jgi:hypothetical protein
MTPCTGSPGHDIGHPYVRRLDGELWCLRCYAYVFGRPVIQPVTAPTSTRDRLVTE